METDQTAATLVSLRYETPHIAVVTLDNPPVNTFTWESRQQFNAILDELDDNLDVRAVVVTGAGSAFTAGANLREDQAMSDGDLTGFIGEWDRVLNGVERFRAPVIAAINGPCVGGGFEFALAHDIRVCSTEAFFIAAGVNVGLIVNFWRLPRIIGLGPAKEILLTGRRITAEESKRWGLVSDVFEPAELLDAALGKAERIATRAPLSVEKTKACANDALEWDRDFGMDQQVEAFLEMFRTEDHKEAMEAFFERRDGNYKRR